MPLAASQMHATCSKSWRGVLYGYTYSMNGLTAGVMIGRAALGRPWLFTESAAMLSGQWPDQPPPALGGVLQIALQHLQSWADWEQDEL